MYSKHNITTMIDALTEAEAKARLARAEARLDQIRLWQRNYYNKKKEVICKRNREAYHLKKDEILARRRKLYNTEPARREKRRERYLRAKEKAAAA